MLKKMFVLLSLLVFGLAGGRALAANCVEVDVELTPEVQVATTGQGFIEVTNCGDEAATIMLALTFERPFGSTINIPSIPVVLGAGETMTRNFRYPAPPPFAGQSFGICATATVGEVVANDCAYSMIVDGGSTGSRNDGSSFALSLGDGCLETNLEITDTVWTTPGDFFAEAHFELTNCGNEVDTIELSLDLGIVNLGEPATMTVVLGAGEMISREWKFPAPPPVPAGEYTLCVTATSGETIAQDCETVTVLPGTIGSATSSNLLSGVGSHPNPFNPDTKISFSLAQPAKVHVSVVNVLGQTVRTLINSEVLPAGENVLEWDGRNDQNTALASGIYFYRISAADETVVEKMVLLK